ncbi:MAG: TetR/AcrR family transcriptional regulator [Acidobacteriota bacterium]
MSKGDIRRQQIVDTAMREASNLGLEGITLGVLADKLRLSKSGLFAHFESKEQLQLAVLEEAIQRFIAQVVQPGLAEPRGEPRVVALWEGWQRWILGQGTERGCFFMSLTAEYDDRPGAVREGLVRSQKDWLGALERAAGQAVSEGHFRPDLDLKLFAYEFTGLGMALQYALKLVGDPKAASRARQAFAAMLARSRRVERPARRAASARPRRANPARPPRPNRIG